MRRGLLTLAAFTFSATIPVVAHAAPPTPSGAHPRIFLTAPVLSALDAKSKVATSATANLVKLCDDVAANPSKWTHQPDYDFVWGIGATACGIAWQLTKNDAHAANGIKLLTALLDDRNDIGDGAGGNDVVQHDSGYYIRVFGPYSALAYDWLHEAPGMDATLKTKAQTRFKAWVDYYTASGYLKDEPGANYHSGYVYAKTLISIAMAGDDPAAATYFTDVVDNLFKNEIVGKGLAKGGVLQGGDWAEGWQYGPLSVLSYALSARAIAEQGATFPELTTWNNELAIRFFHALTPNRTQLYTGGDFDDEAYNVKPHPRVPLATLLGPSSDEAAGWAAFARQSITKDKEQLPFLDALAEARAVAPVDLGGPNASKWYVASGTRRLYMRSGWEPTASWAEFQSSPHKVPDHEHADASNLTFYRGADALVIDPSPYGSLSTLTGNSLTVESNAVGDEYKPSQAVWDNASELPWARSGQSGIVAARGDIAKAFVSGAKADVPFARREMVFLPEGDIVLVDRARTDDAARGLRVRLHAPTAFTLVGSGAKADVGGSTLRIQGVVLGGQTPTVKMSPVGDCYSGTRGGCENSRFAAGRYDVRVPGPSSLAIHVLSGLAKGDADPTVTSINDPSIDAAKNPTVVGTVVQRGTLRSIVVASSAKDGAAGASLAYLSPAGGSRNVVFDAPEAADGASNVVAVKEGSGCRVTITAGAPGQGFVGRPLMFTLGSAEDPCAVLEDKIAPPAVSPQGGPPPGGPGGPAGGPGADGGVGAAGDAPSEDSGCGCVTAGHAQTEAGLVVGGVAALAAFVRRVRRRARPQK